MLQTGTKGAGKPALQRQLRQTRSRSARHTDSAVKPAVEVSHHNDEEDVDIEHLSDQPASEIDIMDTSAGSEGTSSSPAVSVDIMSSPVIAKDAKALPAVLTDVKNSPAVTQTSPAESVDIVHSPSVSVDVMASPAVPVSPAVLHPALSVEHAQDVSLQEKSA